MSPTARKIVFLHAVKTGGTTFRNQLAALYGQGFHMCVDASLSAVQRDLDQYDCVELHIRNMPPMGWVCLHAELAAQDRWDLLENRDIFIMFREPVDQILSNYFYMVSLRARIEPRMKAIGVAFPESIEDFLDCREHFNNQTAFVLGKSQQGGDVVGPADLAKAKDILQRLKIHVGLTERYDDSVRIFEQVTGKKMPAVPNANRTPGRLRVDQISSEIQNRIRERSSLDIELYRFATELFTQDVERYLGTEPEALDGSHHPLPQRPKPSLLEPVAVEHVVGIKRNQSLAVRVRNMYARLFN